MKAFKLNKSVNYDAAFILHKSEGRLLLFDKNGLYNEVMTECFSRSQGNVLLILFKIEE